MSGKGDNPVLVRFAGLAAFGPDWRLLLTRPAAEASVWREHANEFLGLLLRPGKGGRQLALSATPARARGAGWIEYYWLSALPGGRSLRSGQRRFSQHVRESLCPLR